MKVKYEIMNDDFIRIIDRINKEKPNFKHIFSNLPYNSESHRKAVEEYSFELLKGDILKLKELNKFKKIINQTLIYIERKDAKNLLPILDELKHKLETHQNKMTTGTKENQEIILLKPNFFGIGINLKALINRIFKK